MSEGVGSIGGRRILYVDDEESLVMLGADLLEDYGYQVDCACSGDEALSLFRKSPGAFDVVVTDESMPGMTGIELAQEIYRHASGVPIIICSGHLLTMHEEGMEHTNIQAVLAKTDVCLKLPDMLERLLERSA